MPEARHLHQVELPTSYTSADLAKDPSGSNRAEIVQSWLVSFEQALYARDTDSIAKLIYKDGWWRDHLALSWDFRTLQGRSKILDFLVPRLPELEIRDLASRQGGFFTPSNNMALGGLFWIEAMFHFETAVGLGRGVVRLVCLSDGSWVAHMIYTSLQEITGYEAAVGYNRPSGGNNSVKEADWYERREKRKEFLDEEPAVLIIGAGHAGLNTAARCQALGLSCLIIDKNERIGDNWRKRYKTLVTHDPVQFTHMAYLPFPENWPLFTPKDKLADWFENYANAMELNAWMQTTIKSAEYSDETRSWVVELTRENKPSRILKPQHIVLCTGQAGEPRIPRFQGRDAFKGLVYHASEHKDATYHGDVTGKKVIVVGTGNSGHDIAQNYVEHGAAVQMIQRGGTYVLSASRGVPQLYEDLYYEHGPPTEEADVYSQSLPIPVQFALNVSLTHFINQVDGYAQRGLEKAGFKLDFGFDGSGIFRKYITTGGGYYIDVGASQLIIDGKIKMVQSPEGIRGFNEKCLILADGRELEADIVVLATGYDNMKTTAQKILGSKITDRCKDVWGLDEEGEVNTMWRPSGHPNLWFLGGNLALCRIYSKFLALQIRARTPDLRRRDSQ